MMVRALYAIGAFVAGALVLYIVQPSPEPVTYTEIVVRRIQGEPDTVMTFVDRIVYVEREPELTVTEPGGATDVVSQFCAQDTVVITATDTVVVAATPVLLIRSIATDAGWFFQKDRVRLYGPLSTGDLIETRYVSRPGWQARAEGSGVIFREPRFSWLRPAIEAASYLSAGFLLGRVF